MKNIFFIIAIMILLFTGGCSDFLEETPQSFLSPTTFFNSEKNIEIGVNGIYDVLGNRGLGDNINFGNYNQGLFSMGVVGTDQMRSLADNTSNRFHQMDLFAYTSSSEIPRDVWRAHYIGINRANTVINRTEPLLNNENFDSEKVKRYLAEARFLRAFFYFNLVRFYGDIPLKLTETASLTAEDVVSIARSPILDIYEQIEKDLLFAQQYLLLPSQMNDSDNGRAKKTAAWSLLARVYTTWATYPLKDTSKWALAKEYAKKVIDSGEHKLLDNFIDVFGIEDRSTEINDEIIFAVKFSNVVNEGSSLGGHNGVVGVAGVTGADYGTSASYYVVVVEKYFYQSFNSADQRRDWTCSAYKVKADGTKVPLNENQMNNNIGMAKFRRDGTYVGFSSPYDYPLIRYADVLLMYAEATAQANGSPNAEAYEAVNMVRRRAFGKPVNTADSTVDYTNLSLSQFIDAVLQERSWELCSEDCSRWHDLIRYEQLGEVVSSVKRAAVLANFDESKHKLFPIPLIELDSNPLMDQNPGY